MAPQATSKDGKFGALIKKKSTFIGGWENANFL
jgi:hypothetical protein